MLNNYFMWTLMKTLSKYLSWEYRYPAMEFNEEAYGWTWAPPTWQKCIGFIKSKMPLLLTALFVDKHINKTAKQHVCIIPSLCSCV